MTPIAFITGATSGIGLATAHRFSKEKFKLILCGRRQDRLKALQEELSAHTEVTTLSFDVRDQPAVQQAIESLPADWDAMMDINVKGLLYVSQPIIQTMIKNKNGHIINIGSTAGKEVYPKGNVYCASKHAVDAINQGMRMDLCEHGIRVGAINPGLVETEFSKVRFKGDDERADQVYKRFKALQPEDIADIICFTVTRPYHVNIADLVVMPTAQASSAIIKKS